MIGAFSLSFGSSFRSLEGCTSDVLLDLNEYGWMCALDMLCTQECVHTQIVTDRHYFHVRAQCHILYTSHYAGKTSNHCNLPTTELSCNYKWYQIVIRCSFRCNTVEVAHLEQRCPGCQYKWGSHPRTGSPWTDNGWTDMETAPTQRHSRKTHNKMLLCLKSVKKLSNAFIWYILSFCDVCMWDSLKQC